MLTILAVKFFTRCISFLKNSISCAWLLNGLFLISIFFYCSCVSEISVSFMALVGFYYFIPSFFYRIENLMKTGFIVLISYFSFNFKDRALGGGESLALKSAEFALQITIIQVSKPKMTAQH